MISTRSNIVLNDEYIEKVFLANIKRIRVEARHAILPPPDVLPSELAEQIRYLDDGTKWYNKNAPHIPGIIDAVASPLVREITIMGSSQCAKTEAIINIIFWFMKNKPCKIMLMFPTDGNVKDFVNTKLKSSIENTREIKRLITRVKEIDNSKGSSVFYKFPGGWLKLITGSAASGTRGISADVTITDDVDQLVIGQQREGDPAERLKKRTTKNKYGYLHINVSTPTILGQSRIDAYYGKSSMAEFWITCPHCNTDITFKSERLSWEKVYEENLFSQNIREDQRKIISQDYRTAAYPCDCCGALINETERLTALENGYWKDRADNEEHKGFFIAEISSTISSFANVAKQIIQMNDHPEKREVLYNTVFGLPYSRGMNGEKQDPEELLGRVEPYIDENRPFVVPNEIYFAVMTQDIQKYRNEVLVLGIGYKMECWVLLYQKIYDDNNDPMKKKTFAKAHKIFKADWRRQNGTSVPILRHWVDSSYLQKAVADYTRGKYRQGVCAIRGRGGLGIPIIPKSFGMIGNDVKRIEIGSNYGKELVFRMLKNNEPGPDYIHFCDTYCDKDFFDGITAEVPVTKHVSLIQYQVYEKHTPGIANEPLDLLYMAIACAIFYPIAWERLKYNTEKCFAEHEKKKELTPGVPANTTEKPEVPAVVKKIIKRGRRIHARRR